MSEFTRELKLVRFVKKRLSITTGELTKHIVLSPVDVLIQL